MFKSISGAAAGAISRRTLGLGALGLGACLLGTASSVRAQPRAMAEAAGDVLLTVTGQIGACNCLDGAACFDMAMLRALGPAEVLTTCPWFDGRVRFTGVRVDRVLDAVGAEGERVTVIGRGGEQAELPVTDLTRYGVMLAHSLNGVPVSTRYMGPLFVVYPFDSAPELKHDTVYSRSLYNAHRLVVA